MNLTNEHRQAIEATPFTTMVANLAKPGADILATLTPQSFHALRAICEAVVIAGEDLDALKKVVIYNKMPAPPVLKPARHADEVILGFAALTPEKAHLLHMALGLAGEAAEMLDQVMNHAFFDDALDVKNVIEEGGDALFYIEGLAQGVNTTTAVMQDENKVKLLGKRYASGSYSDAAAIARADKTPSSLAEAAS